MKNETHKDSTHIIAKFFVWRLRRTRTQEGKGRGQNHTRGLSNIMGAYWTHFAKHGNPNEKEVPEWPAFSTDNPRVMYLKTDAHPGPVPDEKSLKVFDDYFEWRPTPEGKEWVI